MMKKLPVINIVLFVLTLLSTLIVGAMFEGVDMLKEPLKVYKGMAFSFSLLTILILHEFAHYFASMRNGIKASLPFFIPFPNLFGTLGAFIKMRDPITTRNALLDIGSSGPIVGFIASVLFSVIGLMYSAIVPINIHEGEPNVAFGGSLLYVAFIKLIIGNIPDNYTLNFHAFALAGWIGFFVTSMNLIPIGQLDGGHILYALIGDKHVAFSKILLGVLAVLGIFVWEGWLIWAVLLLLLGFRHPPIMHSWIPLDSKRRKIGWLSLGIFVLTFTPVPIIIS